MCSNNKHMHKTAKYPDRDMPEHKHNILHPIPLQYAHHFKEVFVRLSRPELLEACKEELHKYQ